jgi:branched-subunit amino acid transport protein
VKQLWWVVLIGGVVTYAVRGSFLLVAERFDGLRPRAATALRMIPPAALAALAAPAMLRQGGVIDLWNPILAGGVIALALGVWRRSLLLPLVAGFVVVTVLGLL